jgi:hypothetical protein
MPVALQVQPDAQNHSDNVSAHAEIAMLEGCICKDGLKKIASPRFLAHPSLHDHESKLADLRAGFTDWVYCHSPPRWAKP